MEGITTRVYRRVKGYWRRRRYERLDRGESRPNRRTRFWRIRIPPKLRLKRKLKLKLKYSPKKLLIGIRDGYVNMMMRMANSPVVAGSGGYGEGVAKFGVRSPVKEYDEKLIMEIYKTLAMKKAQLVPEIGVPQIGVPR